MAWSGTDVDDVEQNYNARLTVPEYLEHIAVCRNVTASVKADIRPELDLAYGRHPRQTFDWYDAGRPGSAVHVFIHGGFWRANDKSDFGLVARPFVDRGVNVALINYPLCPEVDLYRVVESAVSAIAFIAGFAARRGADAGDLTLSGHSAGAHLAAMVLAHDWKRHGFAAHPVRAAVLISGIYELEPVLQISVNRDEINLTPEMVAPLSPMRFPPAGVELLLPVGEDEAPMWKRQSGDFAAAVRAAGTNARYVELPGRNHCTLMETFANAANPLPRMTLEHLLRDRS